MLVWWAGIECFAWVIRWLFDVIGWLRNPLSLSHIGALAVRCNRMVAHSFLLRTLASLLDPYTYSLKGIMGVVVGLILIVFVLVHLVPIVVYPPYSPFITLLQFLVILCGVVPDSRPRRGHYLPYIRPKASF